MKINNHGGARKGAGRKPRPGWQLCGFRLQVDTFLRVKRMALSRQISQSKLVNEILQRALARCK
jgi:hypothetical protein